jgi:hypothetical protein
MKTRLLIIVGLLMIALGAILWVKQRQSTISNSSQMPETRSHVHSPQTSAKRVPAFYKTPPSTLPPTLLPDKFIGKTREAYKAVREIPNTIAQLPCYCYCDEAHGHKSLHSCYENEHASGCAVCVDEALMAYRLEKEKGLAPSQIRKLIIEKYSSNN